MKQVTFSQRARYFFDNTMSQGTIALIGWLTLATVLLIIITTLIVLFLGGGEDNLVDVAWTSAMHTMDAGALAGETPHDRPAILIAMVISTFGGIFIFSTLIGVLGAGIESKLEELRKGRSFVIEQDHTIILGWSSQIFAIISELVIANKSRPHSCIVILAEKDKVEMEDEIHTRIEDTGKTRIVCRTGSPIDLADLQIVNPNTSRSIIILSSEADDPDSQVIKTTLALVNNPQRRTEPYHIVAEIRDEQNLEVAKMVGRDEAKFVLVDGLISRIAVQTCRQSGLSVVYTELLDFDNNEIYFHEESGLVGKTFGEALFAYEDTTVIGLRNKNGVQLKPALDTCIEAGDKLIVLAEDDNKIRLSGKTKYPVKSDALVANRQNTHTPERTLLLGWNQRGPVFINQLDSYVAPGSEIVIVADTPEAEAIIQEECANVKNQVVKFHHGNTTDRRVLDALEPTSYDHIVTLSYSDTLNTQEADARTLITLLHLRDISEKTGNRTPIVSEMLDVRNQALAEVTRADDFIISEKLVSLMLSQVSENLDLMAVFDDLFDPAGAELYLKPAMDYVRPGIDVNFYTVVEAARRRGEVVIGYRLLSQAGDISKSYGIYVNPKKSETITFSEQDRLVVLSDN